MTNLTAVEGFLMPTVTSTRADGPMTRSKGKARTTIRTAPSMWDNGSRTGRTERGLKHGRMVPSMTAISSMVRSTVRESLLGLTTRNATVHVSTKGSGGIIGWMGTASLYGVT